MVAEFLLPVLCQAKCFIYLIVKIGIVVDAGFTICFPPLELTVNIFPCQ